MNNLNKLAVTVIFVTITAIFLISCSKTGDSGYKYPNKFPKECIALYDRWWILLDKMKATGRFEEESLEQRNKNFTDLIRSFKNLPRERTPPIEEYIQACIMSQQTLDIWEKGIENIDSKSNEELARTVGGIIKSK